LSFFLVVLSRNIQPIYNQVTPPIGPSDSMDGRSCVRYLHISEIPDQYSIGIFVFAPFARIPLHDHPDMCVLSRVLYGDLQRLSLDLARDEDYTQDEDHLLQSSSSCMNLETAAKKMKISRSGSSSSSESGNNNNNRTSSWLGGFFHKDQKVRKERSSSSRKYFPKGTKKAYRNHIDKLQAPEVTVLYPYEGNLHEFVAGPQGAAILDVLLPPYDNKQNRDCTFYEIHDAADNATEESPSFGGGKEACYIVPTGQPESFHCISGQYRDLGGSDE
jgi:hypothetical protein